MHIKKTFSDIGLRWKRPYDLDAAGTQGDTVHYLLVPSDISKKRAQKHYDKGRLDKLKSLPYYYDPPDRSWDFQKRNRISMERGYPTHGNVGIPSRKKQNYKAFNRGLGKQDENDEIEEYFNDN